MQDELEAESWIGVQTFGRREEFRGVTWNNVGVERCVGAHEGPVVSLGIV